MNTHEPRTPLPEVPDGELDLTGKDRRRRMRLRFRALVFGTRKLVVLYLTHPVTKLIRVVINRGVSNESMLELVTKGFSKVPTMPIRDARRPNRDEMGRRLPFPTELVEAGHQIQNTFPEIAGRVLVGGRWLYDKGLFPLIALTFPRAIDCMAYVRGLGAPAQVIFKDVDFTVTDVLGGIDPFTGVQYHAGSDGSGRIHSDHWIFEQLGKVCVFQIRIWMPILGCFWKGILVPDDRCVNEDGSPTIWLDYSQGKGRHKKAFKSLSGVSNDAFDSNNMLVKPEALFDVSLSKLTQVLKDKESLTTSHEEMVNKYGTGSMYMSILQDWSKAGKINLCWEIFMFIRKNKTTMKICSEFILEAYEKLARKGGLNAFLEQVCEENIKPQIAFMFCKKLEINPLRVPMIWDMVQDVLQRKLYHLAQGCGKTADRYVLVMDNSVPEGHVVMGHRVSEGRVRFTQGTKIALSRLPLVAPQGLLTLTVINLERNPKTGKYQKSFTIEGKNYTGRRLRKRFEHLLIKTEKGEIHTPWALYMNPKDVALIFGDDDGDIVLVSDDQRMVILFENKTSFMPGKPDAKFLFEPEPQDGDYKAKVATLEPDNTQSDDSKRIIGLDGQGPVGACTVFQAAFEANGMEKHSRAAGVWVQESIDSGKHSVRVSDPNKLIHDEFWEEVKPDIYKPVNCEAGPEWYDEEGKGNVKAFMSWAYKEMWKDLSRRFPGYDGEVTLESQLQWRPRSTDERKKIKPDRWASMINPRIDGGNLVDYIFQYSYLMWEKFQECYKWDLSDVADEQLKELLPKALGIKVFPMKYNGQAYRRLLEKSGLMAYGEFLASIAKQAETSEEFENEDDNMSWRMMKNRKVDAEYAILCHKLQQCTVKELTSIWVTELERANLIRDKVKEDNFKGRSPETSINRAFRAVAFPNSPVLEQLGLEFPEPCPYLNGNELENHFQLLNDMVKAGQCTDHFHLGPFERLVNDRHEEMTGIPYTECHDCPSLIEDRVVTTVRRQKEDGDSKLLEVARKTASGMNRWLQGR